MKRLLGSGVLALIFCTAVLTLVPVEALAQTVTQKPMSAEFVQHSEKISIMSPGHGLRGAKGDGTDETEVIQAIFDYATSNHKTVLIPKDYTFIVDRIEIYKKSGFAIQGFGTLKHKVGSTRAMLHFNQCSNFYVQTLNTDGNSSEMGPLNGELSQDLHSTEILNSRDIVLKNLVDKNPGADSLYLNNVNNVRIGTFTAIADKPSGRDGFTIIKGQNVVAYWMNIENVGAGIVFEPNNGTDHIRNVVIKEAKVRTAQNGLGVVNQYGATVEDIVINAQVTMQGGQGQAGGYVVTLSKVNKFRGNIGIVQEDHPDKTALRMVGCNNVRANLSIDNAINGVDLGKGSSDIHLTGTIKNTLGDGISIWEGLDNSIIDMDIIQAGKDGRHGGIHISYYGSVEGIVFKGDYSYSGTGKYCFLVDGETKDCYALNLRTEGWPARNLVIGRNAGGIRL